MDFGDIGQNFLPLVLLVVFLVTSIFLKKRRGGAVERTPLEVVSNMLSEIIYNQQLMEAFLVNWQVRKFKTGSWNRNKNKLDFLDHQLQITLSDAFGTAEDFNQQIDAAKKHKTASYLANINVEKLRVPLAKCKQGLEEWLQTNLGQKAG